MKIACIVPSAGKGNRFGHDIPKQFHVVHGKTILEHALFSLSHGLIKAGYNDFHAIIPCANDWKQEVQSIVLNTPFSNCFSLVHGGKERFDSILNAFHDPSMDGCELVLIHDAARPFVPSNVIRELCESAKLNDATIPVLPLHDTIKIVNQNTVIDSIDRNTLRAALTPQMFHVSSYKQVINTINRNQPFTDDASMFESLGLTVHVVEGNSIQFKITNQQDFELAQMLAHKFYELNV